MSAPFNSIIIRLISIRLMSDLNHSVNVNSVKVRRLQISNLRPLLTLLYFHDLHHCQIAFTECVVSVCVREWEPGAGRRGTGVIHLKNTQRRRLGVAAVLHKTNSIALRVSAALRKKERLSSVICMYVRWWVIRGAKHHPSA